MSKDLTWKTPKARLFSTPLPKETRTYKPVSHRELADTTLKAIHKAGFKLDVQEYTSAREGLVANARYTISDIADSEMQLEIGWQNSYDKTLSLKFAIGTRILICDNGCVSGDMGAFKKKHVGDVKDFTPPRMIEAIKNAGSTFETIQKQRNLMKSIIIDSNKRAEILGRMFLEKDLIGSTQLNIIKEELTKPTHDYKSENSLWELYNHTTFAMKHLHPRLWIDNHVAVHNFFIKNYIVKDFLLVKESHIHTDYDKAHKSIIKEGMF
jgi:hypothetical protein